MLGKVLEGLCQRKSDTDSPLSPHCQKSHFIELKKNCKKKNCKLKTWGRYNAYQTNLHMFKVRKI